MTISRNMIWCALVVVGSLNAIQAARLIFYKGSLQDPFPVSLDNPTPILNLSCYDPLRPTVFYAYGYTGQLDGPDTSAVIAALTESKKYNTIAVDWETEASDANLGMQLGYLSAARNSEKVGIQLCDALIKLANAGISTVHLIGHSLGAHLMGSAGRCVYSKGKVIARISGFDPARQLFEDPFQLFKPLDKSCAKFVDIVHCSPGKYGTKMPSGTVDLWPNYNSNGLQPGCPEGSYPMFSREDLCSHVRCLYYLIESVGTPTAFPASAADNYNAWVAQNGISNNITYLGVYTNTSKHGDFYLSTNAQSPYSKGQAGLKP